MKKKTNVIGKFSIGFNYTETINEMIKDGTLTTEQEIRDYIKDCLVEDIQMFVLSESNVLRNIDIKSK
jgi:hypothetical protein